jgi:hypothetical protein
MHAHISSSSPCVRHVNCLMCAPNHAYSQGKVCLRIAVLEKMLHACLCQHNHTHAEKTNMRAHTPYTSCAHTNAHTYAQEQRRTGDLDPADRHDSMDSSDVLCVAALFESLRLHLPSCRRSLCSTGILTTKFMLRSPPYKTFPRTNDHTYSHTMLTRAAHTIMPVFLTLRIITTVTCAHMHCTHHCTNV